MKEPFLKFIETGLGRKFVLIACGLPSTGKTGATREVERVTGYPALRTDLIRREFLKGEDIFDEKMASDSVKNLAVYEEMFKRADKTLKTSEGIILDATFISQSLRRRAAEIAARHNLPFIILETVCPQEVALKRIRARTKEDYQSNAITEQAYFNVQKYYQPVDLADLKTLYPQLTITNITVDTSLDYNWYVVSVEKHSPHPVITGPAGTARGRVTKTNPPQ